MIEEFEILIQEQNFDLLRAKLNDLIKKYNKTTKRFDKVIEQSDAQQLQVVKMAERLKALLDNTSQGFLQFGKDMIIEPDYSRQVEVIFNQPVKFKDWTSLLYQDTQKANRLKDNLLYIIENPDKAEIIFSLLEREFIINDRFIEIEYKILNDNKIMAILTDVTEQRKLQEKIDKETQILKMVVEVVVNKEQFIELKNKYIDFVKNIEKYDVESLKRELHTFKGLFAQKALLNLPNKIHELEQNLQNINKDEMLKWLDEDIKILQDILGEDFFKTDYVLIDKDRIEYIISEVKSEVFNKKIVELIESLKYFNIANYMRQYKNLINQLSVKLEKPVKVEFNIENIYLPDRFKPFLDSLVHIFRNSLDHGIESLEERILKDKPEIALIKCDIYQEKGELIIKIFDDGAGIDIEKIKQKAVEKNLLDKAHINILADEYIVNLIFEDNFSTKDEVTSLSGRGVGLSAVKQELDKLMGSVSVKVENGTEFKFKIPLDLNKSIIEFIKDSKKYIEEFLNEKVEKIKKSKFKELKNCATIDAGDFILGISATTNKTITQELLNIIAGYFIKKFGGELSIPYKKCLKVKEGIKFKTKNHKIMISYISK